ncbi:MAG: T9SS type A sorting domain-containing protein, partial [bacterium]
SCIENSRPSIFNTIFWCNDAIGGDGDEIYLALNCSTSLQCSSIDVYDGIGGNGIITLTGPNMFEDPLFCYDNDVCDPDTLLTRYDMSLHGNSPCAEHNSWWFGLTGCGLVGALPWMCFPSSVESPIEETSLSIATRCYPNPFNPHINIYFTMSRTENVRIDIHSIDGRLVNGLVDQVFPSGSHAVQWFGQDNSGRTVASGTYFYRLSAGPYTETRRMVLVR